MKDKKQCFAFQEGETLMCDMEENWWCKMCFTDEQKPYELPDHPDWKESSDQNVLYITPCLVPLEYGTQNHVRY